MDVCRTCMSNNGNLQPLFSERDLPYKIRLLTNINVIYEVGLPSLICEQCIEQLEAFHKFHKTIHRTDIILRCRNLESIDAAIKSEPANFIDTNDETNTKVECNENLEYINEDNSSFELGDKYEEQSIETISKDELLDDTSSSDSLQQYDFERLKNKAKKRRPLFKCKKCSYATYTKNYFDNHICSDQQVKIICEVCGKKITRWYLPRHLATHSTDNKTSCYICGKVFKNYGSMRVHMYMHVPQESVCELCGKTFQYIGEYTRHLKVHREKVKDCACEICGKMFYKYELQRHMDRHNGIRHFPCEYCGKRMSSRNARNTHRRRHTNEKPYACEVCGMGFPQKVSLRTHMKSKHNEELEKYENTELL